MRNTKELKEKINKQRQTIMLIVVCLFLTLEGSIIYVTYLILQRESIFPYLYCFTIIIVMIIIGLIANLILIYFLKKIFLPFIDIYKMEERNHKKINKLKENSNPRLEKKIESLKKKNVLLNNIKNKTVKQYFWSGDWLWKKLRALRNFFFIFKLTLFYCYIS